MECTATPVARRYTLALVAQLIIADVVTKIGLRNVSEHALLGELELRRVLVELDCIDADNGSQTTVLGVERGLVVCVPVETETLVVSLWK